MLKKYWYLFAILMLPIVELRGRSYRGGDGLPLLPGVHRLRPVQPSADALPAALRLQVPYLAGQLALCGGFFPAGHQQGGQSRPGLRQVRYAGGYWDLSVNKKRAAAAERSPEVLHPLEEV